jgi:hypothetical protein
VFPLLRQNVTLAAHAHDNMHVRLLSLAPYPSTVEIAARHSQPSPSGTSRSPVLLRINPDWNALLLCTRNRSDWTLELHSTHADPATDGSVLASAVWFGEELQPPCAIPPMQALVVDALANEPQPLEEPPRSPNAASSERVGTLAWGSLTQASNTPIA